ncbi:DUF87 domain-containing protein, partial [Candidatus Woesearchaeota archaeon]|nr:DUF87 domain-containing protein [Candidatus Woesearchaeota archaeon]
MPHNIVIGRVAKDRKKFGEKATIFLGRHYVKMEQTVSLSSNILMDVARTHVVLVDGKRGSGKSYTLGVIAEEMTNLPEEVAENLSILIFDTMGIFWTMKHPNQREETLLSGWKLKPEKLENIDVYIPEGHFKEYKKRGILADYSLSIKTSELDAGDWADVFGVDLMEPIGVAIEKGLSSLEESKKSFGILDIINEINSDKSIEKNVKDAAINRFLAAETWGLFSKKGTEIKDLVRGGRVSVVDI